MCRYGIAVTSAVTSAWPWSTSRHTEGQRGTASSVGNESFDCLFKLPSPISFSPTTLTCYLLNHTKIIMTAVSVLVLLASSVAALAAYRLYLIYILRLTAQQHGCKPVVRYKHKDPVFGLDIFLRTGDAMAKNQFLVEHQRRYDRYGHTFETLNLGSRSISSVHPENLRAVFSKNAADWGIQPLRLHSMGPFCGKGFITTDGSDWRVSHDLLKPGFHRSKISDFGPLEEHFQILLGQISKDGTKFDLQPYLLRLVCLVNSCPHFSRTDVCVQVS